MDEKEKFIIRYGQPSDDAIIAAGTTYLALTGKVDAKAMEEAVKQAFCVNSYKHIEQPGIVRSDYTAEEVAAATVDGVFYEKDALYYRTQKSVLSVPMKESSGQLCFHRNIDFSGNCMDCGCPTKTLSDNG